MPDPLGLIPESGNPQANPALMKLRTNAQIQRLQQQGEDVASFKDTLLDQIRQVNELQANADRALDEVATGQRDDIENVMIATQKADTAFRMLLQVRNKVMDAYEEVKQIRV